MLNNSSIIATLQLNNQPCCNCYNPSTTKGYCSLRARLLASYALITGQGRAHIQKWDDENRH
uniref:Uncharacterized protein n=1 Tax=Arundo donax TaxID=35708 RepID=A0A0A9DJU8_ARUDO